MFDNGITFHCKWGEPRHLLNAISIPRIPFTKNIIPRLLLSDSMIFYFGRQCVKYNTAYFMPYI